MVYDAPAALAHVSRLVEQALDQVDDGSVPTSVVTRKALRIARLRNEWNAMLWLHVELRPNGSQHSKAALRQELAPHFTAEALQTEWERATEVYIEGRATKEDRIVGSSLGEVEAAIAGLREQADHLRGDAEMRNTQAELVLAAAEREQVLARVRQRVAEYLSRTERELLFGQISSDVFERNRKYVDERLAAVAPQALEQFAAAYRRQAEGDTEARSQALTSCRRILKTLADALYPATNDVAEGVDGATRKMSEDKFIARLTQYAGEKKGLSGASQTLLVSEIKTLGERLDALNALGSKGVHDGVSAAEVDQCLIQTYLTAGDLLRLADDRSAAPVASA